MDAPTIAEYDATARMRCAQYETADFRWLYDVLAERLQPGSTILEIGCGSGRDARALAKRGYLVTATDGSIGMLAEAQCLSAGDNPTFAHKAFPLANSDALLQQCFDAVLAIAVLMHIPAHELDAFFAQISRLLHPAGLFLCSWCRNHEEEERRLFVPLQETPLYALARTQGLIPLQNMHSPDVLGRKIAWQTSLFTKV